MHPIHTLHLLTTGYMTGVGWYAQRVTYPSFLHADSPDAPAKHRAYTRAMGPVAAPAMLLEAGLQMLWVWRSPSPLSFAGLFLLSVVWIDTFALIVPIHNRLCETHDPALPPKLLRLNRIRALAWTARCILLLV